MSVNNRIEKGGGAVEGGERGGGSNRRNNRNVGTEPENGPDGEEVLESGEFIIYSVDRSYMSFANIERLIHPNLHAPQNRQKTAHPGRRFAASTTI